MVILLRDQKFDKLADHHRDLGVPWTDNIFPANHGSIGLQKVHMNKIKIIISTARAEMSWP